MKTTVTKEITWDCAHRLDKHPSKCKNLHGHTYKLQATFTSERLNTNGMVVDFGEIKDLLEEVKQMYDHKTILSHSHNDLTLAAVLDEIGSQYFLMTLSPTAENMAQSIFEYLRTVCMAEDLEYDVVKVRLYETPTSYAEVTL